MTFRTFMEMILCGRPHNTRSDLANTRRVNSRTSNPKKLNYCGPTVKKLRMEREWSQEQLATKCQLHGWDASRDVIARLELQNRLVTDWEIIALSQALGCKVGELFA